jgi:lysyl-tRNA synthetase class 2
VHYPSDIVVGALAGALTGWAVLRLAALLPGAGAAAAPRTAFPVRLERHALGPRVHVFGVRIHEWHLGAGALGLLAALDLTGDLTGGLGAYLLAVAGMWLIAKDWRDLTPGGRDVAAWRLGLHRPPSLLRSARRGDWVPALAAMVVAATAVASLISTLTPNIAWRGHLIAQLRIVHLAAVFHAAVIPTAAVLLVSSYSLWHRRERALWIAFVLLVLLGVFHIAKGLDFEEGALSFLAAGVLWWGRDSFVVRPSRMPVRGSLAAAAALAGGTVALAWVAVISSAQGRPSPGLIAQTTFDLLTWQAAPLRFADEFGFVPQAVGTLGVLSVVAGAWLAFRPLTAPAELPDEEERHLARALVEAHGSDTLAYFKLREDKHYFWTDERDAFLGYRIENGVLLVSGDPVGPPAASHAVIRAAYEYADRLSLRFAVVGASQAIADHLRQAGLKTLYIGDEAIVEPAAFSLEGRSIRKVRQAVTRVERLGYRMEQRTGEDLDPGLAAELEAVSAAWRAGRPERGFSMALDRLGGPLERDTVLAVARDRHDAVAGFLQLVPSFGRAAMSLAQMRRLPESPNGLMEFLIVRTIQALAADGVEELSLNFSAFGRVLRAPSTAPERLLGRTLHLADRWFQIERLYRFNAKFSPHWQPRYLVYQSYTSLPRTALGVMWVEGQVPKPALRLAGRQGAARPAHASR